MDALTDGLGGLDTSLERPADELADGSYSYFAEGDLLLAKVTPCFENGKKALVTSLPNRIGFATSEVHVIRPDRRKVDPNYLRYLLSSERFQAAGIASMTGAGGLRRISDNAIKDFLLPVPDLTAQKTIAAFLDRETARVNQLIEKKQRLLCVIHEREDAARRLLLSGAERSAVSRRSTDTPWLSSVPDHWEIIPLRHLVQITTGSRDTQDRTDDGRYPFYVRSMTVERIDTYSYDEEAVLTSGDGAGVGKVFHHVTGKFELHQRMYAFTNFTKLTGRYFFHFLRTFFHLQMTQWSAKSTVDSVRMTFLKSMLFAIPPREEQEKILTVIDIRRHLDERIIVATETSIKRLREFRAALITAAVAGEINIQDKPVTVTTKLDPSRFRLIVGAEIIHQHRSNPKFGRVKLQKELYLAEAHIGISELQRNYFRQAAGPLDRALIEETERAVEAAGYYRASQADGTGTTVTYTPLSNAGQHNAEFKSLLGPRAEALGGLIGLLRDFGTEAIEAITTLYAVWNDALIDGRQPDDSMIVNGVLTEWHEEKGKKFKDSDLRHWLDWMKRNGLTPRGQGPRTTHTMTRDMFA